MALNDTLLNIGAAAMQAAATHASVHTAAPNASGSNASTAGRQTITWETAANGDMIATVDLPFTGGAANGPVHSIGFWSASTGGTWYGFAPITSGDTTFNAAGEYTAGSITVAGTAS